MRLSYGMWITEDMLNSIDMREHGHVPCVIKAGFGPRFIVALSDVAQAVKNLESEGNYVREVFVAQGDHY